MKEVNTWQGVADTEQIDGYKKLEKYGEEIKSGLDIYQLHVLDQIANAISGSYCTLCSGELAKESLITIKKIIEERSL